MFPSCTRVTASVGFCCAVVFSADARDSSSGGGAGWPRPALAPARRRPPAPAPAGAAALLAADDPADEHAEEHAGDADDERIFRHDDDPGS